MQVNASNADFSSNSNTNPNNSAAVADQAFYGVRRTNQASFEGISISMAEKDKHQDTVDQAMLTMNVSSPWRPSAVSGIDQTLNLSGNQSYDYQMFKTKYVNLRN